MSIVKDTALAESGRRKIHWVRDFMPALGGIEARFEKEKPFAGLRVAVSVHLEAKTANLGYVLSKGGAEVRLTGSNPLSTQDDVAAGLASMGVETFGIHGADPETYKAHLLEQEGYTPTPDGWGYIRRNANEFCYQFSTPAQPQETPGMAMQ